MKNKNHTDEENPPGRRHVVPSRVTVILVCVLLFHNPLCTLAGPLTEPQIGLHGVALGLGAKHSSCCKGQRLSKTRRATLLTKPACTTAGSLLRPIELSPRAPGGFCVELFVFLMD